VASLPPPKFVRPDSAEKQRLVDAGRKVFHKIGCAACHVENIGQIQGIYSDLLLHDMGPKLADPVLAQPTLVVASQNLTSQQRVESIQQQPVAKTQTPHMYYGGSVVTSAMFSTGDSEFTLFTPVDSRTAMQTEFRPLETNRSQEWRTPPLWGLADSAPYMHDGRAATIAEAIVLHGGEATATTSRYLALELEDRLALVEFLNCLRAP
jgi:cytochrome c peroxidase